MLKDLPVKVARLTSGEDVICYIEEGEKYSTLHVPMSFSFDYDTETESQRLFINHWLPENVILHNSVAISNEKILFVLDAKPDFIEYYLDLVEDNDKGYEDYFDKTQADMVSVLIH